MFIRQDFTCELQAHRLSSADLSSIPPTSTTPDDFFYILKVILNRLVSSSSLKALHKTIQQLKDIIAGEYASVIQRRIEDVYKNTTTTNANIAQKERQDREQRNTFIVSPIFIILNDYIHQFFPGLFERSGHFFLSYGQINQRSRKVTYHSE